jgi:hypothetical protein
LLSGGFGQLGFLRVREPGLLQRMGVPDDEQLVVYPIETRSSHTAVDRAQEYAVVN